MTQNKSNWCGSVVSNSVTQEEKNFKCNFILKKYKIMSERLMCLSVGGGLEVYKRCYLWLSLWLTFTEQSSNPRRRRGDKSYHSSMGLLDSTQICMKWLEVNRAWGKDSENHAISANCISIQFYWQYQRHSPRSIHSCIPSSFIVEFWQTFI